MELRISLAQSLWKESAHRTERLGHPVKLLR